ncbi:hypothetical protein HFN01_13885 [Rhizobium leguminosarum]|uniref:hypothetical protein n=1 Tax=Rhizobium leguminosarum TaxID=384 RepID=UPI001C97CAC7|nr:hypothetical protein [Rhizobium leguminosarum]MBY5395912.1 hypothetical protein [Rhizobium leguminosarum]
MTGKANKSQVDKFKEAARELETDNDEKRFDERLGKIAKALPRVPTGFKRDERADQED